MIYVPYVTFRDRADAAWLAERLRARGQRAILRLCQRWTQACGYSHKVTAYRVLVHRQDRAATRADLAESRRKAGIA